MTEILTPPITMRTPPHVEMDQAYLREMLDGLDSILWEAEPATHRYTYINRCAETLLGYPQARWLDEVGWWQQIIHPDDRAEVLSTVEQALAAGRDWVSEYRMVAADGRLLWVRNRVTLIRDGSNEVVRLRGVINDITAQKEAQRRAAEQSQLLEAIAENSPLNEVLTALLLMIEQDRPGIVCGILLLDDDRKTLRYGAGPSLSEDYRAMLREGFKIGPGIGSCGSAAFAAEPVMVEDVATDPRWESARDGPLSQGLRACWSTPIKGSDGSVLGTFAMYQRVPGLPTPYDRTLIGIATHLAAIAIARHRDEADRRRLLMQLEAERNLLSEVLQQLPVGVIIAEAPSEQVILGNDQLQRLFRGFQPAMRVPGPFRYQGFHPDGRPYREDEWPLVRAVRHGERVQDEEIIVPGELGRPTVVRVSATPVRDRADTIVAGVVVISDVTELRTVEARQRFLAEVGAVLNRSLDYEETLQDLAHLAVPILADWCVIDMPDEDGRVQAVAVAHVDPEREERLREFRTMLPLDEDHAVHVALRTGTSQMLAYISPEAALAQTADEATRAALQGLGGLCAQLVVPLMVRGEIVGTLSFVMGLSGRAYRPEDLELAEELGRRASIAIANAQLYAEAQAAIRLRDEFFSIASHELKTPITTLLGYAQLVERRAKREGTIDPRDLQAVHTISNQATRLNRLVASLLDLSRIQNGSLSLDRETLDLNDLVHRIVEESLPTLDRHRLQLQGLEHPVLVEGDSLRLEQVVRNLIGNAVKYSPAGGEVLVRLVREGAWVRVHVSDQGIGIPLDAMPQLFGRFFRAGNAQARGIAGMGLGLYVVNEIVDLHGGQVEVLSYEGKGSTFTVVLPCIGE